MLKFPTYIDILGVKVMCLTYSLAYNEHLSVYESVEDYYDRDDLEELDDTTIDSVYQLQIYEATPIGFVRFTSNSIEGILEQLREKYEKDKARYK